MVSDNFKEIARVNWRHIFELGNPEGRGGGGLKQFWKSRWKGGQKIVPSIRGCHLSGNSVGKVWEFQKPLVVATMCTFYISFTKPSDY